MKNSAEGLEPRRECCWDCVSIYENTPEKVRHLPPKNCCNYLVVQGRVQLEHSSHIVKVGVKTAC